MPAKSVKGQTSPKPRASRKRIKPSNLIDILPSIDPNSPNSLQLIKAPLGALNDPHQVRVLKNMAKTNPGNAECFAYLFGEELKYCRSHDMWMSWNGHRWESDAEGLAYYASVATIRARQAAAAQINDEDVRRSLLKWALSSEANPFLVHNGARNLNKVAIKIEKFDKDIYKMGVMNGTLDLHTQQLVEDKRNDFISMQMGTKFDPDAKYTKWSSFLNQIQKSNRETIEFIRRAVGYTITGDVSEQVIFLCYGAGANGKSVFLQVLERLFGDYWRNTPFLTFDGGRRGETSNDLARLKGKRLVTVSEADEDRRLAEARVKSVTGQDTITCRYLHKEFFQYHPTFKIWMAMNHLPTIRNTDRGIWRRIRLIPFTESFEGRENPYLKDELLEELPGILNWALEGLRDWQQNRLGIAEEVRQATENYRQESDLLGQWLEAWTRTERPGMVCPALNAYKSYAHWCKEHGFPVASNRSFGLGMNEKQIERKRISSGFVYIGLEIVYDE